jgi:predicted transcriptional regulator
MTAQQNDPVLNVRVGEDWRASMRRARATLHALEEGKKPKPHFSVGYADMGQLLAVFTPKRWVLLGELRALGPLTVAELARRLGRDYKNVHTDVAALHDWLAVERLDDGRVRVPWSEIVVDLKLPPQRLAA